MKVYLHHGTMKKFDKFDLSKFNIKSLLEDTQQFGFYFYCIPTNERTEINAIYYARDILNKKEGYVWNGEFELNKKRVLQLNDKMSIDEYTKMCKKSELFRDSIQHYHRYVNNGHIFNSFTSVLWNKYKDWNKVADELIKLGYDGTSNILLINHGTIVIWNTKLLNKLKRYTLREYIDKFKK